MKRISVLALMLAIVVLVAACGQSTPTAPPAAGTAQPGDGAATPAPAATRQLRVGGAATGTFAYSVMVAISEAVRLVDPSLDLVVQATPGSTNHYFMFENNELDLGTGFTPTDYWAIVGAPPLFDQPMGDSFNTIIPFTLSRTQVFVRADSDVWSMSDLNGRAVYVGDPGGAGTMMSEQVIEILGLDVNGVITSRAEGREMLRDGRVDALMVSAGAPYAGALELQTAVDIRLLSLSEEEVTAIVGQSPFAFPGYVEVDVYDFLDAPVRTIQQVQNLNVNSSMDEDTVYRLTAAIVESWDEVVRVIPGAATVSPLEDFFHMAVAPLHPGAVRYFEGRGLAIPDALRP